MAPIGADELATITVGRVPGGSRAEVERRDKEISEATRSAEDSMPSLLSSLARRQVARLSTRNQSRHGGNQFVEWSSCHQKR